MQLMSPGGDAVTATIVATGVIALLDRSATEHAMTVSGALIEAGVPAIEIPLTAPRALVRLTELVRAFGDRTAIGAGMVLSADQAEACIDAGAAFLTSPTASPDVVAAARVGGVAVYPGAHTLTEVLAAHRAGASAVQLCPAYALPPRFVGDVHATVPDAHIIAAGALTIDEAARWIRAGAVAATLGAPLIGTAYTHAAVADQARRALKAIAAAQTGREPWDTTTSS
ncbi:MAG: bifunctional 4-hydroxy-2-oxoglutarate aldolase/2-dehydro-3-deoxy-phosphogluconate aldolase [Micromonosporaceae bacterium]|jgi:2-dehydro-3-deoxyphosphogluconate aldolase/(4S)-4-hydroxy-2-oxoglutarate aldolase|nr:bifunctional 4-hydroxy-2-oxoglutarate aldolase/2-dehydro-3-deoxy-phosphogluconate aldolase [Micromonosporaceae bacterium]